MQALLIDFRLLLHQTTAFALLLILLVMAVSILAQCGGGTKPKKGRTKVVKKGGARKAVKKAGTKKGAKQAAGGKKKDKPVKKPSSPARQFGIGGGVIVPPTVDDDGSNRPMPGVTVPQTVQTTYAPAAAGAGADEYEAPGDLDQEDGEPEDEENE